MVLLKKKKGREKWYFVTSFARISVTEAWVNEITDLYSVQVVTVQMD